MRQKQSDADMMLRDLTDTLIVGERVIIYRKGRGAKRRGPFRVVDRVGPDVVVRRAWCARWDARRFWMTPNGELRFPRNGEGY